MEKGNGEIYGGYVHISMSFIYFIYANIEETPTKYYIFSKNSQKFSYII